ncbi:MAG: M15 family metallopeptidase [Solobacterium sp.]|nr:M15 family metallopeptidase [Solobacterium sp.]
MSEKTKNVNITKKRKPKRRFRKSLLIIPLLIAIGVFIAIKAPRALSDSKIRQLGYTQQEADAIAEQKLTDVILEKQYYSRHLADEILKGTVQKEYLALYAGTEPTREFTDKDFLLYRRFLDYGYEEDQLMNLFNSLKFSEMTPLLVMDYQWNEQFYIDDVIECREQNAGGSFVLGTEYRQNYKMKYPAEDPENINVLVNKNWYLPADYRPSDLKEVSTEYAVDGMRLRKEAADAVLKMCRQALDEGHAFFVSGSYMDYVSIQKTYDHYVKNNGEYYADMQVGKPGFSEFQTGLSVSLAATFEKYEDFRETECYDWLKENSADYGFIERYPYGKEDITGCAEDAGYYRYLGKDLAGNVKDSGLTYDEYYCLILKGWDDDANRPNESLIENTVDEITHRN